MITVNSTRVTPNKLSHNRESSRSIKVNKDTRWYDSRSSQRQDALMVTSPYLEWAEVGKYLDQVIGEFAKYVKGSMHLEISKQ